MSLSVLFARWLSQPLFLYHQNGSFILLSSIRDGCTVFICEYALSLHFYFHLHFMSNICLKAFFFNFSDLVFLHSVELDCK